MNRIAIVTGGASGIGRALCAALVADGDTVIVADLNLAAAQQAAESMRGSGRASAVGLDVTDPDAVQALVDAVVAEHGRLDLMVNNAGIGMGGPAELLTHEHWQRTVDVNLMGVVNGVLAAYPLMVSQGHGHIVNTASLAGLIPSPGLAPYVATKYAVVGLSRTLRLEARGYGVQVTVVCPGFTDTPILDSVNGPSMVAGRGRELASRTPGGLYSPESLAQDILEGIRRNRTMVVAPRSARWIARAERFIPAVVEARSRRIIEDLRASLPDSPRLSSA